MVFVNDKKYACETCIKGHRSSTCNHTERPLFEIKKKGRPITQCEHCRELRKTKQVHVKCLCEGREDPEAVSHSIPAKKANRKGPPPCAAFPNGIQHLSDSEVSGIISRSKPVQKIEVSPSISCTCKSNGTCECCTSRRTTRVKRSTSPPSIRPRIGDMAAPQAHGGVPISYPASDAGSIDVKVEHEPHALIHGHCSRMTHGTSLYNPYGIAHGVHRSHEMRGHENDRDPLYLATEEVRKESKYVYPILPLNYDQEQHAFSASAEVSPMWSNGERLAGSNTYTGYDTSEHVNDQTRFPTFGSVNVDAWLRQLAESNANSYTFETTTSPSQPNTSLHYPSDPSTHCLPVPPPLDVSHELSSNQDPDFPSSNQYDLLPEFMSLGIDLNEATFLGESDQEYGSNSNGAGSDMFNYSSNTSSAQNNDFLAAPTPFPALPPLSSMLTPCDIGPSSAPPSSVGDYEDM
ncbi:ACE1 transcription factor [Pyrrhoderma noxium]|uniref:ACE1 transcription factor n=1 Tax=Pyrrhoderma noxium TaxID=2282107 RepID=A0A286UE06_9AGAM|nr:ACE1 transcription factor [Pyrrhoderma noxium]